MVCIISYNSASAKNSTHEQLFATHRRFTDRHPVVEPPLIGIDGVPPTGGHRPIRTLNRVEKSGPADIFLW